MASEVWRILPEANGFLFTTVTTRTRFARSSGGSASGVRGKEAKALNERPLDQRLVTMSFETMSHGSLHSSKPVDPD